MHSDYGFLARDDRCGFNYYQDGEQCVRRSNWDVWGRWLTCGIAITIAIALLSFWVRRKYSTTTTTTTFPDSNSSEFYNPTYGGYGLTPSYGEVLVDGHARGHGSALVPPSAPVPVSFGRHIVRGG